MNAFALGICVIVGLGLALVVGLHIYIYSGLWLTGGALRKRLAAAGRTMTLKEAQARISRGEGRIVVDAPTVGWNVSRVWWTDAPVIAQRPGKWANDKMCPDEDRVNYDTLIDSTTGVAKIVCPFVFMERIPAFLRRHFGCDRCPFIFTAGVEFERQLAGQKAGAENGEEGEEGRMGL